MRTFLTVVLLYLCVFTTPSTAHIISLKLQYDKRHMIPFSEFEFSTAGYVSFVISSMTVNTTTSSLLDPSRIGFILQEFEVRNDTRLKFEENNTICALDFKLNSVLFTFQNLSHSSFNKSFPVTYSGMKSLFFVNCNNESFVAMDGRAELYNIDDDGTTRNYLSAGLTEFPFVSFILSIIYLSFLGFWILVCINNQRAFNMTHLQMGGLLAINFVYFICVGVDLLHVKAAGSAYGLDVLLCIFQLSRGLLLFTLIFFLGAGLFIWKPLLLGEDVIALAFVVMLQLYRMLAWEVPELYDIVLYDIEALPVVDVICCLLNFNAIRWSSLWLHKVCQTDLNAYRNSEKLQLFTMLLVLYMVNTRVIVFQLSTRWMKYAVKEASTLVFIMMMLYMFRPVDRRRIKTASENEESWLPTSISIPCFHSPV